MNWELFAQLVCAFIVAALGWLVAHYFSSKRDHANDRRKLRMSYLLEAYRKLEGLSNRDVWLEERWSHLEAAIADIQLLGSPKQVTLARKFAHDIADNRTAHLDDLIFDLRQSLRKELKLEPISESIIYLRRCEGMPDCERTK